jgi:uncharacterized protein with gpF-like domain
VLPKTHPFWQTNQPGNLWNCKCGWEETFEKPSAKMPPTVPPARGLEGNPAETGEIFTDKASYFMATKKMANSINKMYNSITRSETMNEIKKLYSTTTEVEIDGETANIEYNKRTAKHIANDELGGNKTYIKNQIAGQLDKYLASVKFVAWENNSKTDKKPNAAKYYYFEITLPNGQNAYLHVEKSIKEGRYILYSITDKLRKTVNFYESRTKVHEA